MAENHETKWTPGPWGIHPEYPEWVSTNDADIAEVSGWPPQHDEEQTANRHLIAAAPELYEALLSLCDYLAFEPPHDGPLVTAGRAALAKARGEA